MTPETKKISSQKATALLRKEGKKTADLANGSEIITSQGVVLKEGGDYYLTTEPKPGRFPAVAVEPDADASEFIETTTKYLTKPEQTFVEPKHEKPTKAPLASKATKLAYSSGKVDLAGETGLFKGGTRRRKGTQLKRALKRKSQGRLTERDIIILSRHASGCTQAARANQGF